MVITRAAVARIFRVPAHLLDEPNPGRAEAARNRRRSNASGKHGDRRLKRLRDRGARKRAALKEETE